MLPSLLQFIGSKLLMGITVNDIIQNYLPEIIIAVFAILSLRKSAMTENLEKNKTDREAMDIIQKDNIEAKETVELLKRKTNSLSTELQIYREEAVKANLYEAQRDALRKELDKCLEDSKQVP